MWWWIVPAVIACVAIGLAIADVFWPITVGLVGGIAIGWWLGKLDDVRPWFHAWMLVAYVLVGFAWTFFKWTRLVEDAYRNDRRAGPPRWQNHSYDFAAYFFYWPLDVVAYVLSDLLSDAWTWIARMVARSFDRYAEWRFRRSVDTTRYRE